MTICGNIIAAFAKNGRSASGFDEIVQQVERPRPRRR